MSLMRRLMNQKLGRTLKLELGPLRCGVCNAEGPCAHVTPTGLTVKPVAFVTTARGSCKAVNAETGRQCALLAGHTCAHRHGRTDFWRCAEPGTTSFSRRDALDVAGTARSGSFFNPHLSGAAE